MVECFSEKCSVVFVYGQEMYGMEGGGGIARGVVCVIVVVWVIMSVAVGRSLFERVGWGEWR